jgi:hypothetical protein
LRHRSQKEVRLSLCSIDASRAVRTDKLWNAYVDAVGLGLGNSSEVSDMIDSEKDPKVVKILGWPTRQALFRIASEPGRERQVELHVLVTSPTAAGVAFVMSGPESQVEEARRDLAFLLSRLNHAS